MLHKIILYFFLNWVPNSRWTEESEIGPCGLKTLIKKLAFTLPILSPQKAKTKSQTNGLDLEDKRDSFPKQEF